MNKQGQRFVVTSKPDAPKTFIYDNHSDEDTGIEVSGNWLSNNTREQYVSEILNKLNAPAANSEEELKKVRAELAEAYTLLSSFYDQSTELYRYVTEQVYTNGCQVYKPKQPLVYSDFINEVFRLMKRAKSFLSRKR